MTAAHTSFNLPSQLVKTVQGGRGRVSVRLVVTEECLRGEGEWHKVHDVAWKNHPDLPEAVWKRNPR